MIEQIAVGGFDDNFAYVIHDGTHAAVVDPSGDIERVLAVISRKQIIPVAVLLTHTHFDHHDKLGDFLAGHDVPVYVHKNGIGRTGEGAEIIGIDEGEVINIGEIKVRVIYTPGHIDDAVCFYIKDEQMLITGDTLFVEGCGRVSGEKDAVILYESLQRLKKLPDETKIYPGHDYGSKPNSTIEWEKQHNRFFLAGDFDAFKKERL